MVSTEYDKVKILKNMLNTLKIETSVEVPTGVRRNDNFMSTDNKMDNSEQYDPDVWPPPTPVDHR